MTDRIAVLALALLLDTVLGEPPSRLHPVVLIGKAISCLEGRAPRSGRAAQFLYGTGMALAIPAVVGLAGLGLDRLASRLPRPLGLLVCALALKPAFAARDLLAHLERVRRPLEAGRLAEARASLQMIVSRDTSGLSSSLVAAAAVESAAENASDSFVAPILYYSLFGPAGALAYRAVNTLDAMIGYHGQYEYLGKAAARLDDLANLAPARLAALLISAASLLGDGDPRRAWRIARRDRGRTESPNAGWPMAAMAGGLGIELEKVDHYRLGDPLEPPAAEHIARAMRVVVGSFALTAAIGCLLTVVSAASRRRWRT